MEWRGDNRGQSIQVGAILLFATLIIALSVYQASVVPEKNQRIEFDAYEDATDDFVAVRNTMLAAAGGDGSRGVTVKTGAQYPPRVFLVNDLEPAGRIATTDPTTVTVGNVNASVTPLENVGAFVSAENNSLSYETRRVRFEPDYNQFSGAPLVTANGYVFRAYDRPVPAAPQTLLDGNTVSLTTVRGNFSASGYRSAVTAVPVSVRENTVTVTNDDPGPVTLTVPSELNASEWRSSVFSEQAARPNVSVVDGPRDGTVTVELSGDRYQLELAAVELRERNDDNEVDEPPARYLVPDGSRDVTVAEGERARLVVETRDALNNPRSNAPVRFEVTDGSAGLEAPDGTTGDPVVVRSDGEGESVAFLEPTSGTATVEATLNVGTPAPEKSVTFTVRQSGSAADGNGSSRSLVRVGNATAFDGEDGDSDTGGFNFTVRNDFPTQVNLTDVTVLPEDDTINGLSDAGAGEGQRRSELFVENATANVTVDVPSAPDEYAYIGSRGLTLSVEENRLERTVVSGGGFSVSETDVSGNGLTVNSSETATIELGEFYRSTTTGSPEAVNATNEDFRVVVSYERDAVRESSSFVVYPQEPRGADGGGEGGTGSADQVSVVDGSTPAGGSEALVFDIENTGNGDVSVSEFAVSTPARQNPEASQLNTLNNRGQPEVEITGGETDGSANRNGNDDYATDGTVYALDSDAVIGAGDQATVDMRELNDGNLQLTYELVSDSADADVTVTLGFADGSSKDVYLRVTNVNS